MNSLKKFKYLLEEYSELRNQINIRHRIMISNGIVVENVKDNISGISVRTIINGYCGMATSNVLSEDKIKDIIFKSSINAKYLSKYGPKKIIKNNEMPVIFSKDYCTKKIKVSEANILLFCKELDSYIENSYPDLCDRNILFCEEKIIKLIINSDGSEIYTKMPIFYFNISIAKEENNRLFGISENSEKSGLGEFEDFYENPSELYKQIDSLYEKLQRKKSGVKVERGYKDVILTSDVTAMIIHEAVGHLAEADYIQKGAITRGYFNKKISSEKVTITDYANTYKEALCPFPIFVDDEGFKAKDCVIINKGILSNAMNTKLSALEFNQELCGNARASTYKDVPIVRMRNTCLEEGEDCYSDMLTSINDGYVFQMPLSGQADINGDFIVNVSMGYEIKNGKISRPVIDTTLSGNSLQLLNSIAMVGNDFKYVSCSQCTKQNVVHVGMGAPSIKCKVFVGE